MSNLILVHGAWQGAWSWERVIPHLEMDSSAHETGQILALDLPGHGQRFADEIRRITMDHYIHAVVTPVQVKRLDDVVLVGHGFAATFLPQVALELGDRVKHVVFIGGELPPEGRTVHDRLSLRDKVMLKVFKAEEKGFMLPDFILKGILCNGLDRSSTSELLSRLVPEPFLPWLTPVSRQGFAGNFPTTYITLTRDKAIPPGLQRRYSQSLGDPRSSQTLHVEELDAGHGALFSHPREVADVLLKYT